MKLFILHIKLQQMHKVVDFYIIEYLKMILLMQIMERLIIIELNITM